MALAHEDAVIYGIGVARLTSEVLLESVALFDFFKLPEPCELKDSEMWGSDWLPWGIWNPREYDDGGGAAIAAIRFRRCT